LQEKIAVLQERLDQLHRQIATLETDIEDKPEYGLGRGDPWVTRWELNQALLKRLRERAASTEQALARIRGGTYGVCERCGSTIAPQRMAALPDARLCIQCAREDAQSDRKRSFRQ
jgi:RNA polymerase-binding transcription factor DksA